MPFADEPADHGDVVEPFGVAQRLFRVDEEPAACLDRPRARGDDAPGAQDRARPVAFVGGKAQDISVKQLDKKAKADFKKILDDNKVKVLMEFVTSKDSQYGVSIGKANVFHVYK